MDTRRAASVPLDANDAIAITIYVPDGTVTDAPEKYVSASAEVIFTLADASYILPILLFNSVPAASCIVNK